MFGNIIIGSVELDMLKVIKGVAYQVSLIVHGISQLYCISHAILVLLLGDDLFTSSFEGYPYFR